MHHSQQLAPEGVNLSHRLMRIQARPKILLCQTFEEAWAGFSTYRENVLGVISDIEFPMDGRISPEAGVAFARRVRDAHPDVPVALQSSVPANRALAESVGAAFLQKDSPVLLQELRQFMVDNFGFGDFVFRLPDGTEVGRASDLRTLEELLGTVPGREHRVPLRAQPLLEMAQGEDRVRRRPPHAPAQGVRLRRLRGAAPRPDRLDSRLPRAAHARDRRRLRPPDVRHAEPLRADRRRLARRQGPRPRLRQPPARRVRRPAAVPRGRHRRAAVGGRRDRRVRPVPGRQRPQGLCDRER